MKGDLKPLQTSIWKLIPIRNNSPTFLLALLEVIVLSARKRRGSKAEGAILWVSKGFLTLKDCKKQILSSIVSA
jgi:hypothetical protein